MVSVSQGAVMLRKILCAAVIVACCIGITLADEITASITKVEGNKVTFTEFKGVGEKGEPKTMEVADKVKVTKGKFDFESKKIEAGEEVKEGLKNELFTKIGDRGVFATIVTDKDNKKITEIRTADFGGGKFGGGKGFGKKEEDKK
jgi:hypothetical protein